MYFKALFLIKRFYINIMKAIIIITLSLACFVAMWFGTVPIRYTPVPHVNLETTLSTTWIDPFEQVRVTSMRYDNKTCKEVLKNPYIDAQPIKSNLKSNGCGWVNGFKVKTIAGAKLGNGATVLSCPMATSMAMWMQHVQKKAKKIYGSPIVKIHHFGTYNCRKIRNGFLQSQHSHANAIDVSGFTLKNGKTIRVLGNWHKDSKASSLIRHAYLKSCTYFNVHLGPGNDKSHQNHFHLDNGPVISWCRFYDNHKVM
jgi:hypothetical protein